MRVESGRAVSQFGWTLVFLLPLLNAQQPAEEVFRKLLPAGAKIIETADVTRVPGRPRSMVLWMMHPQKRSGGPEYCGTPVEGDYWEGPTRLSLIDPVRRRVINEVTISGWHGVSGARVDKFRIPFLVSNDYYRVPHPGRDKKGLPKVLDLRDLTGEGISADFVLLMYEVCGVVSTGLFGYQPRSDHVVQYQVEVHREGGKHLELWVEQVFATKAIRPGYWSFTWGPGHGVDDILHEEVSFDRARRLFVETETVSLP